MRRRKGRKRSAAQRRITAGRRPEPVKKDSEDPLCSVPGCGRTQYAVQMCQTHHRQMLQTGTTKPIRLYHRRSKKTVKYSGIRLLEAAAAYLDELSKGRKVSRGATMAQIIEAWVSRGYKLDE